MAAESAYQVLGVAETATDAEIRAAYRSLALKLHPDKNPGHEDEFQRVSAAYALVSDAQKRAVYDAKRQAGSLSGMASMFMTRDQASSLFAQLFQGFGAAGAPGAAWGDAFSSFASVSVPKSPDLVVSLPLSLEELFHGARSSVQVQKRIFHPQRGEVVMRDSVSVVVQPGWRDGTQLRYEGRGEQLRGMHPGDLVIRIKQRRHQRFLRKDDDLYVRVAVPLADALTGATLRVTELDESVWTQRYTDQVLAPGTRIRVPRHGMPIPRARAHALRRDRGDMIVDVDVVFPERLSEQQRRQIARVLSGPAGGAADAAVDAPADAQQRKSKSWLSRVLPLSWPRSSL